jgi:hypothetical protein
MDWFNIVTEHSPEGITGCMQNVQNSIKRAVTPSRSRSPEIHAIASLQFYLQSVMNPIKHNAAMASSCLL